MLVKTYKYSLYGPQRDGRLSGGSTIDGRRCILHGAQRLIVVRCAGVLSLSTYPRASDPDRIVLVLAIRDRSGCCKSLEWAEGAWIAMQSKHSCAYRLLIAQLPSATLPSESSNVREVCTLLVDDQGHVHFNSQFHTSIDICVLWRVNVHRLFLLSTLLSPSPTLHSSMTPVIPLK